MPSKRTNALRRRTRSSLDGRILAALLEHGTALQMLALGAEEEVHHVACQPATEFAGRIPDWVGELRQARTRGETVVFVADSHGRAERVIELLADYEVPAAPIDRGEDAHSAAVTSCGRPSVEGLPPAGRRAAALGRDRRLRRGRRTTSAAARPRARSCPTSAISRSAISSCTSITASACSSASSGSRSASNHRSSCSSATPARTSCSCRSNGWISFRSTPAPRGLARSPRRHHLGKGKDARQESHARHGRGTPQALRVARAIPGHAFSADSHWQQEFEDAFEWDLTVDQTSAVSDIKRDMESPAPMDRLLCGDVGYGKTEVAMRAAFKAVMDGKQVAFLAPTTVLAFQHLKTCDQPVRRVSGTDRHDQPLPFEGGTTAGSRRSRGRQGRDHRRHPSAVVEGRAIPRFGLLVVDEEQRFGVAHKERINSSGSGWTS